MVYAILTKKQQQQTRNKTVNCAFLHFAIDGFCVAPLHDSLPIEHICELKHHKNTADLPAHELEAMKINVSQVFAIVVSICGQVDRQNFGLRFILKETVFFH